MGLLNRFKQRVADFIEARAAAALAAHHAQHSTTAGNGSSALAAHDATLESLAEAVGRVDARLDTVERRLSGQLQIPSRPSSGAGNSVSATLDDVVAQVAAGSHRRVALFGDEAFRRAASITLSATISDLSTNWLSNNIADLAAGAKRLEDADLSEFDAIIVGGPDVRIFWTKLVRELADRERVLPAWWVGEDFEYCVGQMSLPSEINSAKAYLFQHFDEYFHVRDPLLAQLEVYDSATTVNRWVVMRPGESLVVDVNEWLPERTPCHHVHVQR